jgi:hypothetical protein
LWWAWKSSEHPDLGFGDLIVTIDEVIDPVYVLEEAGRAVYGHGDERLDRVEPASTFNARNVCAGKTSTA